MDIDTREKLIFAATPLFAYKGFAAVSIRELAEAAGVNVAAISYHFGGKEALYHAVLEYQFEQIAQALEQVNLLQQLYPEERLEVYAKSIVRIHAQRPFLIRFMHSELPNPTKSFETVVTKYISRVFAFINTVLCDGIAAGSFNPDLNTGFAALSLAGILNFYFIGRPLVKEILPMSSMDDGAYIDQAFSIFMEGIRRR